MTPSTYLIVIALLLLQIPNAEGALTTIPGLVGFFVTGVALVGFIKYIWRHDVGALLPTRGKDS